ncbi:bis(5'-nucleosyl)-tetraphosphatase (symmetrical) YqeK [Treponema pectinovorum]|uniref:bis(5'-nucleosyl)-tetraphosphatase (symmetrical) YqeK n=1 Tax=Treponema pectinovorum TaxID=164 RepID=UPI0011C9CDF6|nr:bis(5'-nucleosyl)-tetraphosphatase (symmetrical) YqeK [Treponema pectinovorum]
MALKAINLNDKQELESVISKIDEYAKSVESEGRYEHSVRTAQTAEKMCSLYGISCRLGYLAGLAHDMCKEFSSSEILELVKEDGKPVSILEQTKPSLLHGRAAAVLLSEKFGVKDRCVLDAISNHTFACANLCDLGKIIFVADKIEPGRPQSTDEYRKKLFALSLDCLTYSVLKENIEYLEKRGKKVASPSYELLTQLKVKIGETDEVI